MASFELARYSRNSAVPSGTPIEINRNGFLQRVHREDLRLLEDALGYERYSSTARSMDKDESVTYHYVKDGDKVVWFFVLHGAKFCFKTPEDEDGEQVF